MLTQTQIDEYNERGAIVVPDVLSPAEVADLRRVTDEFVEKSRAVAKHTEIFDLEDTHSPAQPRVRRIKAPHLHHAVYAALVRHPRIVEVLTDLWGPNIRFDTAKLNLKSAGFGAAVEWHQDWAFYPHTNDDLAAVGVMMDDMDLANGPLLIVPGSHKGNKVFDHHADGKFCGAMDPGKKEVDLSSAFPLLGRAGSITVHHVRAVHGSAVNTSNKDRRLLLFQYRAADAWPLIAPPKAIETFDDLMVAGVPTLEPRLTPVPVRLPLPPADLQGSIYENQKALANRYFDRPATVKVSMPAE
ncbi:MAG: phytanoyl-CoA dioxygenase family protein [Acetobacteraceae bacterium]|nr:phytanoyl-CoA dioxygenase family protein [Acetobacteraceae bacterium]